MARLNVDKNICLYLLLYLIKSFSLKYGCLDFFQATQFTLSLTVLSDYILF